MTCERGTTNGNARGSVHDRRARRAFLMKTYASDVPGFVRCYRCGDLLYNPDDVPMGVLQDGMQRPGIALLTIDRIIPGCRGGTYRRNNIRPSCQDCASHTGALLGIDAKRAKS